MRIFAIVFLMLYVLNVVGQDSRPSLTTLKTVPTYGFSMDLADTTVWLYKGGSLFSTMPWTQLLNKRDSVKLKSYATNYKLTRMVQLKDSTVNKNGYTTFFRANDLFKLKTDSTTNTGYASRYAVTGLARQAISITTTGTSGAATYSNSTGVLNIPQYAGGGSMIYPTGSGIPIIVSGTSWGTTITDNSTNWNTAYTNRITSLTTTGSSGAATLSGNVLNIPVYSGGGMTYPASGIALSTGAAWGTSITDNSSNWNTAYTDRLKWDGGSTGLVASTGRTSLGATTVGGNLFTATNPSAITFPKINADNSVTFESAGTHRTSIGATTVGGNFFTLANPTAVTFPRINADNTVSALDAATFRTAIGAGTSSTAGTVTSVGGTGTVSGLSLSGTVTSSGNLTLGGTLSVTAGNFSSQTANQVLIAPNGVAGIPTFRALLSADIPTLNQNTTGSAGSTTASATFNSSGTGDASPTIFNGSTARTISYNTLGAAASGHNHTGVYEVPLTFSTGLNRTGNTVTSTITQYTDALARGSISLTTTGTSGAATYSSATGIINIPTYGAGTGTVTSVAALTIGTAGTDLSSSVATGSTTPVITLNVPTASATNRGVLSTTDWSTFNGKQPAGTYSTDIHSNITALNAVSGTNTGDNAVNSNYSGLVTNATHTGDVTGSAALTLAGNVVSAGKMKGATSTALANGTAGNLLKSLGDGTFGWDATAYVSGTPWTSMGYVTGTPWTSMGYLTSSSLTGYATQSWVGLQGYVTGTPWTGYGYITSDVYWTGTSTNLNATTARSSLGLGNAATANFGTTSATIAYGDHTHSGYVTGTPWTSPFTNSGTITAVNFQLGSDRRYKENIQSLSRTDLMRVGLIEFKKFNFKKDQVQRYGVIAQEVELFMPELVSTDPNGMKAVSYIDLLIAKIAQLEERINKLENER